MQDAISEIRIDRDGRLHVVPTIAKFPFIYREAMQVGWDSARNSLCSPIPREWSYVQWFEQIARAAAEQGVLLHITDDTVWKNTPMELQENLMSLASRKRGE